MKEEENIMKEQFTMKSFKSVAMKVLVMTRRRISRSWFTKIYMP
jgi:hypothetical protein